MKTLVILCAPSGVGKSTIRELLAARNKLPDFACIDTDAVGLNWHVYKGTERENQYQTDCLKRADEISGDKNIFFSQRNKIIISEFIFYSLSNLLSAHFFRIS